VVSSEVGYEKPAPEIFKIALGIVQFNMFKLSLKYIDTYVRFLDTPVMPKQILSVRGTNEKLQHMFCLESSYVIFLFMFGRSNWCGSQQGSACRG
jgi:hypothetical protein